MGLGGTAEGHELIGHVGAAFEDEIIKWGTEFRDTWHDAKDEGLTHRAVSS